LFLRSGRREMKMYGKNDVMRQGESKQGTAGKVMRDPDQAGSAREEKKARRYPLHPPSDA